MKQILFRGAATALVTPMQPDGSLDLETLSRLTEWQIQSSISALVPCGTTGEAATLTDEERFTVIQTVAKTAAGRVPVIAGAGCNDTARAEQNCLAYSRILRGWHPPHRSRSSSIMFRPVPG